jgi:hypothetical protein
MTNQAYACPCCSYLTLASAQRDSYDICPVCFWEDDPVQFADPDYWGGANKPSLNEARVNFAAFGASERRVLPHVRRPRPEEMPRS